MVKRIISGWIILCGLLSACTPAPLITETPRIEPSATLEMPSPTLVETKPTAVSSASCAPITFEDSGTAKPVYLIYREKTLAMQIGDQKPQSIGEIPDLGIIQNAVLAGKTLLVLRRNGLQRIGLSDCSNVTIIKFNEPIMMGDLVISPDSSRVYYGKVTYSTRISEVGFIGLHSEKVRSILTFTNPDPDPLSYSLIGLTEDGKGLYSLQLGQDPSLGLILVVNIENGTIGKELPIRGWSSVALAPNRRLAATPNQVVNKNSDPCCSLEYRLNVYDLASLPLTSPHVFTLPKTPGAIGGKLLWSPDSQTLYFLLLDSDYNPQTSYGLWSLNVTTGDARQVTAIPDTSYFLESISPDGAWITVRHDTPEQSLLVDLQTGNVQQYSVPYEATLAGWH